VSKNRDNMTSERWDRIKAIRLPRGRMVHKSCHATMIPDPNSAIDSVARPMIPYIQKPGITYNVGRNAAKRARRAIKEMRA
jgi:hypothetical protein